MVKNIKKNQVTVRSYIPVKTTVLTYTEAPTSHPDLVKLVDHEGNWTHYRHKPTNRMLAAVNHVIANGYNKGPRFHDYLLSVSREEAKKALESAGERGTRVHSGIRDLVDGMEVGLATKYPSESSYGRMEPITFEEWSLIQCFERWQKERAPRVSGQEISVFSLEHGYAGTVDFLGSVNAVEKGFGVLDWKTSSRIWNEYALQTAAYFMAILEMKDKRYVVPDYTGIIRFSDGRQDGFEEKWWSRKETESNFEHFLAAKKVYEFNKPKKGDDPVVREVPFSLKIEVPRIVPQKKTKSKEKIKKSK